MKDLRNKEYIKLFILSFSILSYELIIIRVLSVIFEYELLFIIISISILGLGTGGIIYSAWLKKGNNSERCLCFCIFLFPFSFPIALWILIEHFYRIHILGSITAVMLPFLIGGILISAIFTRHTKHTHKLYFFDLLGGASGCLLSLPIIHILGGTDAILGIAVISSVLVPLSLEKRHRLIPLIIITAIFILNIHFKYITLGPDKLKLTYTPMGQVLTYQGLKAKWIKSIWDIYSRCDLVMASKGDIKRSIFINGGTQATMMRYDNSPAARAAVKRYMTSSILFFPYLFDKNRTVLNIGSGGGRDVLMALLGKAEEVVAVEINKGVINMVKEQKEYNGDIYGFSNVSLVAEDGRTFIMRTERVYDRIVLSLASTFAFSDINSLAQMENYLYTKEAFSLYLNHLTEDGTVTIFVDFPELLEKFILTAVEVLAEDLGIDRAKAMTYIASFETKEVSGYGYLLLIKRRPFSEKTVDSMISLSEGFGLDPVFIPYHRSGNDFDLIADGQLTPQKYIENNTTNLRPSTDDSPFFLEVVYSHRTKMLVLFLSIVIFLLIMISALQARVIRQKQYGDTKPITDISSAPLELIYYFIFTGTGFMVVEIVLTKRFSFYLGYPHLNIAVIIFTILIGTGVGSLLSKRLSPSLGANVIYRASLFLVIALFLFEATNISFVKATISYPLSLRAILLTCYLFPIPLLLGFYFPWGISYVGRIAPSLVPWLWGINGVSSVLGAVLSVIISMSFGFSLTLYTAIILYLASASVIAYSKRRHPF